MRVDITRVQGKCRGVIKRHPSNRMWIAYYPPGPQFDLEVYPTISTTMVPRFQMVTDLLRETFAQFLLEGYVIPNYNDMPFQPDSFAEMLPHITSMSPLSQQHARELQFSASPSSQPVSAPASAARDDYESDSLRDRQNTITHSMASSMQTLNSIGGTTKRSSRITTKLKKVAARVMRKNTVTASINDVSVSQELTMSSSSSGGTTSGLHDSIFK